MSRIIKFAPNETYHSYTRGVNKQVIFREENDYFRMLMLLLLSNSESPFHMSNLLYLYQGRALIEIFQEEVPEHRIVHILSYSLMPNHLHLILREIEEGGISKFMHRLFTAYSMYFNKKYERTGALFESRFKAKHIDNEAYFRWIFSYVHLNPVALIEPKWEEKGIISDPEQVRKFMRNYKWSSFYDYTVGKRPESVILADDQTPDFVKEMNDLEDTLEVYANREAYQGPALI